MLNILYAIPLYYFICHEFFLSKLYTFFSGGSTSFSKVVGKYLKIVAFIKTALYFSNINLNKKKNILLLLRSAFNFYKYYR